MKRLVPLVIVCALAAATPASAHPSKLTAHQAKRAITRDYSYAYDTSPRYLTVHACRRLNRDEIRCRVDDQMAPGCFQSNRWDALDARDTYAIEAAAPHSRAWGDCPTVPLTPVDGDPTYLPPS